MKHKHSFYIRVVITACLFNMTPVSATDMSSTNYSVKWDVTDGGGGNSSSANYIVESSNGQPTAIGVSSSTNYSVTAGFESIPDSDADKILDAMDNCTQVVNLTQRDTDSDGYGNICDPDFDNNLVVNASDLAFFKTKFFSSDPDADLNGDSVVNAADLAILKTMFFKPPGPSGLVP